MLLSFIYLYIQHTFLFKTEPFFSVFFYIAVTAIYYQTAVKKEKKYSKALTQNFRLIELEMRLPEALI